MDRWQAMRIFTEVAGAGSFAAAGRRLGLSPPAVTRAVAALEEAIGTRLLVRTTRLVRLTEAGGRAFEDSRRILADIAEAEAAAAGAHATPTGTLRITASVLFGEIYVLPILTEFLDRHPAVDVSGLFLDRVVNIVEEGIDVAVRIGHLQDSGLVAIRVGTVRRVVCGAPAYFARHGIPAGPGDLARHRIIAPTGASASLDWRFGPGPPRSVTVQPRLSCNTNAAAIAAALAGWGVTRLLSYQVAGLLAEGRLQRVLAEFEEDPLPIHVVHAEGRRAAARVRSFVDLAVERLRANSLLR